MALSDLKYVTTGAWGSGLARPLTAAEADGNVQTLRTAVQNLIDNPVEGVSVSNITVSGRQLTFHMSDSTTKGPFTLPIAYPRWRGEWESLGSYAVFDIVTVAGVGVYIVAQDHTAGSSFDPTASNADGPFYVKIAEPANAYAPVTAIGTATLTLDSSHAGKYLRFTNVDGCAVTVPAMVFSTNTEIHLRQAAAGAVSIVADFGVTLNLPTGLDPETSVLGDVITLKQVDENVWDVFGNLVETAV